MDRVYPLCPEHVHNCQSTYYNPEYCYTCEQASKCEECERLARETGNVVVLCRDTYHRVRDPHDGRTYWCRTTHGFNIPVWFDSTDQTVQPMRALAAALDLILPEKEGTH